MSKLKSIFQESGIAVPPDHDDACFRCGKAAKYRSDMDGLCTDCNDECEYTDAGYEETIRAELKKGTWFIQSGINHWHNSLLNDLPPEFLVAVGVDPAVERNPVPVNEAINDPDAAAEKAGSIDWTSADTSRRLNEVMRMCDISEEEAKEALIATGDHLADRAIDWYLTRRLEPVPVNEAIKDPWGTPYRYSKTGEKTYEIRSAGSDQQFLTADDIEWDKPLGQDD